MINVVSLVEIVLMFKGFNAQELKMSDFVIPGYVICSGETGNKLQATSV